MSHSKPRMKGKDLQCTKYKIDFGLFNFLDKAAGGSPDFHMTSKNQEKGDSKKTKTDLEKFCLTEWRRKWTVG